MCTLHKAAWVLVVVGALNWGAVGLVKVNVVMALLGSWPAVERVVYVLVGIAGLLMIFAGKCCMKGGCKCDASGCGHCGMEQKPPMMGGQQK